MGKLKLLLRSLLFILTALSGVQALAQPLNCIAGAGVATLLRAESYTDYVGDVLISCTGGDPNQVSFVNIDIFLNTNITSQPLATNATDTEALLIIDEARPDVMNLANNRQYQGQVRGIPGVSPGTGPGPGMTGSGNIYVGQRMLGSSNRITWNGVPIVPPPPGSARTLRITNVRADATRFPVQSNQTPGVVSMFLSASPATSLPLGNSQIRVGTVVPSVEMTTVGENAIEVRFRERFATAFRKRIENSPGVIPDLPLPQNFPGQSYNTESGFTPDFGGVNRGAPGVADNGTRFLVEFRGLPDGSLILAPSSVLMTDYNLNPSKLQVRRVDGWNLSDYRAGVIVNAQQPPAAITVVNGIGRAVYEVAAQEPYGAINGAGLLEQVVIPFGLQVPANSSVDLSKATVAGGYAPISQIGVMDLEAPEPRFVPLGNGVPILVKPIRTSLHFDYVMGEPAPIVSLFRPDEKQLVMSNLIAVRYQDGANWLKVSPITIPATANLEVEVNPAGLAEGTYRAFIQVTLDNQEIKLLPVTLVVKPAPELQLDTNPITFSHRLGDPAPATQVAYLTARIKAVTFQARAATQNGGTWLSVTPAAGDTPRNLRVSADPTGLSPGEYRGQIIVTSPEAVNSPQTIPVTLQIASDRPFLSSDGVVSSASFLNGAVIPGELISLFGIGIGPETIPAVVPDFSNGFPTELFGVKVLFDELPGRLIAVSRKQLNVIVPFAVAGRPTVQLVVELNGRQSAPVPVRVATTKPGLFTLNFMGTGQAAALNQNGTINGPGNPAARGSAVSFYLTGAGVTNPPGQDGRFVPATGPLPVVAAPVVVRIGGREAQLQYAGGAAGLVHGVIQVNAFVPGEIQPRPDVPVEITVGGVASQPGVTIAVQ